MSASRAGSCGATACEIGALHLPLPDAARRARPVRRPHGRRRAASSEYPELEGHDLVHVDVVDDGERLSTIPDASVDFIVANHFLEHTEDPIGTLAQHTRVLRPGGVLFLANPDPRETFDRDRPLTTIEHLARDHRDGPDLTPGALRRVGPRRRACAGARDVAARSAELRDASYSIHFHVWTPSVFAELVAPLRPRGGHPARARGRRPRPPRVHHRAQEGLRKR